MWPTLTALLLLALACTASAKRAGLAAWATEGGAKAQARHVKTLLQDEASALLRAGLRRLALCLAGPIHPFGRTRLSRTHYHLCLP